MICLCLPVIATTKSSLATVATSTTSASPAKHVPAVERHRLQPAGQVLVRLHNQLDQVFHEVSVLVVEEGSGQAKVTHPPSSTDPEQRNMQLLVQRNTCSVEQRNMQLLAIQQLSFAPQAFRFNRTAAACKFIHFIEQQTKAMKCEADMAHSTNHTSHSQVIGHKCLTCAHTPPRRWACRS